MDNKKRLEANVNRLKNELKEFISFFEQGYDYSVMVYELWNAKDVLGHITFWHESFARNISDLGKGIKPSPLKGKLSEVNKHSVEATENVPIKDLINKLKNAQLTIEKYALDEKIGLIPYKKGSRDYSREEHLEIVANHIHKHLCDLRKKYNETTK